MHCLRGRYAEISQKITISGWLADKFIEIYAIITIEPLAKFIRIAGPNKGFKGWGPCRLFQDPECFLGSDPAAAFFGRIREQAAATGLLWDEHFTVDGNLIEAWASLKSFRPKDALPPSVSGSFFLNRNRCRIIDNSARNR